MTPLKQKYKIVFAGTSDFGLESLEKLYQDDSLEIKAVITQPDKKTGRKQELSSSPIKKEVLKKGLKLWQPLKIKDIEEKLQGEEVDLMVVISYGQIIPQEILDIPKFGCLNVHASLLPLYRGSGVISAPILNGDEKTGVTIMKMDAGLDTGDILKQREVKLSERENSTSLKKKLAKIGSEILTDTISEYLQGEIKPEPQDESQASYIGNLKKQDGLIDWNLPALLIDRKIRALNPWPGTFSYIKLGRKKKKLFKILEAEPICSKKAKQRVGSLFLSEEGELLVQCGEDKLAIKTIQIEGKGAMGAKDFLRGYQELLPTPLEYDSNP